MADFDLAYDTYIKPDEGGYSDHPADRGGETLFGVSRRANSDWFGWTIVDSARTDPRFPHNIEQDLILIAAARGLFRARYWKPIDGDRIPDQRLASILFSIEVNSPPRVAISFLQQAVNLFSRDGASYRRTKVDGLPGPDTRRALSEYVQRYLPDQVALDRLSWTVTCLWTARFVRLAEDDPSQALFIKGWIDRTHRFWV